MLLFSGSAETQTPLERLVLDFDRHVTVHAPNPDRPLTRADLLAWLKRGG